MKRRITVSSPLPSRPVWGYGKYLHQCHCVTSYHVRTVISLPPAAAHHATSFMRCVPTFDRGSCLSVCLRVAALLGGWRQWNLFPRSLSALFCTNIGKYFVSVCLKLSPQAACLTFCISVAIRVVKKRENKVPSSSGSWIKLWKSLYIESYLKSKWVHRAFLAYFDQCRCYYSHITGGNSNTSGYVMDQLD